MILTKPAEFGDRPIALDDGGGRLDQRTLAGLSGHLGRHLLPHEMVVVLSTNTVGALAGLLACWEKGAVPFLLGASTHPDFVRRWIDRYDPAFLWLPHSHAGAYGGKHLHTSMNYSLVRRPSEGVTVHPDLSLLVPTSGSTGDPKLVRHSDANLLSSARNVARMFELGQSDRPIASLPLHFTMGLSVVTSHLHAGATLLLTRSTVAEARFWTFIKELRATSFTGVPYSFEMLHRLRFSEMDLPELRVLSNGGGRLRDSLFREFVGQARRSGRRFFATYGQTEGSGRMSCLLPDHAGERIGSIGQAIPEGSFTLVNECGEVQPAPAAEGELIYRGPNVTLGYADEKADLCKGDEFGGVLRTGDLARRDSDGFYYILGRRSRFLKLYGIRVGLDAIENLVEEGFPVSCRADGDDSTLRVVIDSNDLREAVRNEIVEKTGLFHGAVTVEYHSSLPRNEAGKLIRDTHPKPI